MKKAVFMLCMLLLIASVTACGVNQQNQADNSQESAETEEAMDTTVPEDIQMENTDIISFADTETFEYEIREIEVFNQSQKIYGVAYIPNVTSEKIPLVICSHGLGGSYSSMLEYAKQLAAHGVAAYCFDFRGGGGNSSDGKMTEMSVMTEVSDLECVIEAAKTWEFVDSEKIILFGVSQGGIVSAITAARNVDDILGEILFYPAFLVTDDLHQTFQSLDEVQDEFNYKWIYAGRIYVEDMWDYDVYEEIGDFNKKVLLVHGDKDGVVDISYSQRAVEVYEDVEFHTIKDAGHGFNGQAFEESVIYMLTYLQELDVLN